MLGKPINRYLHVTAVHYWEPFKVVEYFDDFGAWNWRASDSKLWRKVGDQIWHISSDLYIDDRTADALCKQLLGGDLVMKEVDLKAASNPVSARQKAMQRKAKK